MTRLERLRKVLAQWEEKRRQEMRSGRLVEHHRITQKIEDIKQQIAEAEEYEPHRLSELVDEETLKKAGIAEDIVKLHLAADFLNDIAVTLKGKFSRLGLNDCSLYPYVKAVDKASAELAGLVTQGEGIPGVSQLMLNDERLIDDLHLILDRYLKSHLNFDKPV